MTGMPDWVPCLTAAIPDAKELLEACAAAGIPAALGRDACCEKGGCAPKVQLFVAPEDVPRVERLLESRWQDMLAREGTIDLAGRTGEGEHEPCPACGTAAALVEGACSDCGLQLA